MRILSEENLVSLSHRAHGGCMHLTVIPRFVHPGVHVCSILRYISYSSIGYEIDNCSLSSPFNAKLRIYNLLFYQITPNTDGVTRQNAMVHSAMI
jgi:hypothetical protein